MSKRKRNYKAEYARRKAKGLKKGLSLSQARGHPKATEKHVAPKKMRPIKDADLQRALKELRSGKGLRATARSIRVTPERLRNQITAKAAVEKRGRKYIVREDLPRRIPIISQGKEIIITVGNFKEASLAGHYRYAVGQFLTTNNERYLKPFIGRSVTDQSGRQYPLETRPNILYRFAETGMESFEQVYRIVI